MRSCTTLAGPAIRRFPGLCSTPLTIRQGHRGSYIAVPATSIALSHNSEKRWLPGVVCGATRAKPSTSWFAAWGPKPAYVVEGHSSTETKERSARTPSSEDESDARFRHLEPELHSVTSGKDARRVGRTEERSGWRRQQSYRWSESGALSPRLNWMTQEQMMLWFAAIRQLHFMPPARPVETRTRW